MRRTKEECQTDRSLDVRSEAGKREMERVHIWYARVRNPGNLAFLAFFIYIYNINI